MPVTWDLITQYAHDDKDACVRQKALELLATGRKEVPATWDLITQYARDDKDTGVRQKALELLATGRKEVPATWDLITQYARDDKDSSIRQKALELLATGRKEVPATWDLLAQCARDDQNSGIRRRVLQLLATRYELDQRSRTILSRDLNGRAPYIDPSEPISQNWVKRCADKLGMPVDRVLEMFQKLVRVLPLRLDVSV